MIVVARGGNLGGTRRRRAGNGIAVIGIVGRSAIIAIWWSCLSFSQDAGIAN